MNGPNIDTERRWADIVAALIFLTISAGLYLETFRMPPPHLDLLGPAFFPRLMIAGLALLGIILLLQAIPKRVKRMGKNENLPENPAYLMSWGTFGFFTLYVLVLSPGWIHYTVATLVFLPAMMLFLATKRRKNWTAVILITLAGSFGITYLFEQHLGFFLP